MATYRKRGDGWECQIRKKGHKPVTKTFRTKAMAQDWARRTEDQMVHGTYINTKTAERTSVQDLFDRYEKEIVPQLKSQATKLSQLKIMGESFGDLSAAALSAEVILDHCLERLEDVSGETVRKELNTLAVVLDTAMAVWGVRVPVNPARMAKDMLRARRIKLSSQERDRRVSREELVAIAGADTRVDTNISELAIFAIETCMRRGEIAKMRPEHRVAPFLLHIPETKTARPRTIPLSPVACWILDNLPKRENAEENEEESATVWGVRPGSITQAFRRLCARLEIEDLHFHDLRHEGTSMLFDAGWQIPEVAAVTGHTDWKSLKRYTHPKAERLAQKQRA